MNHTAPTTPDSLIFYLINHQILSKKIIIIFLYHQPLISHHKTHAYTHKNTYRESITLKSQYENICKLPTQKKSRKTSLYQVFDKHQVN